MPEPGQLNTSKPLVALTGRWCVIVPAYNAGKTIGSLVRAIQHKGLDPLVINDGSTDGTASEAIAAGGLVISHVTNQGKGRALRTGFRAALQSGYDAIMTMDSDGQHDPEDLVGFLRLDAGVAVAIGNRLIDRSRMPAHRHLTNQLMSWIVSRVTGQTISDSQCGYRLFRREVLAAIEPELTARRYDLENEVLLAAARAGWTIHAVPVRTIYEGRASHIHPVADGWRFCCVIARFLLKPRVRRTNTVIKNATSDP